MLTAQDGKLFVVKRAIACYQHDITDVKDVWDLQRNLMMELDDGRKVKIIVVVGCDSLQVNEVDAT